MIKTKVLFVCVHNSARSQIAEAFLNQLGGDYFIAESAGLEPGKLNPLVIEAMNDIGIDISGNQTKSVFDFYRQGKYYNYVITVCDAASEERCPFFAGRTTRLQWSFEDPSTFQGTHEEKLEKTRQIRDQIKKSILQFMSEVKFS